MRSLDGRKLAPEQIGPQGSVLRTSRRPSSVRPILMPSLSTFSHPQPIANNIALCVRSPLYRLQFLGHRVEPYAALATG